MEPDPKRESARDAAPSLRFIGVNERQNRFPNMGREASPSGRDPSNCRRQMFVVAMR
jgi:hypothetical protein